MQIEAVIASYLASYADLKAIHGGQVKQGIAKQGWSAPWQTVNLISDPADMRRLKRPSPRLQIDCYAKTYGDAKQMADLTFTALDGLSGALQGVTFEQCICEEISTDYETQTEIHKASLDAIIIYRG